MINRETRVHNNALPFEWLTMQYTTDTHIFCNLKSMHNTLKNVSFNNVVQNLTVIRWVRIYKTYLMVVQEQKQSTVNKQHCQFYFNQLLSPHISIWIALYGNISIWNFNLLIYKIYADEFPIEILTGQYQTTHTKIQVHVMVISRNQTPERWTIWHRNSIVYVTLTLSSTTVQCKKQGIYTHCSQIMLFDFGMHKPSNVSAKCSVSIVIHTF